MRWVLLLALGLGFSPLRAQEEGRVPRYEFIKENGKPKFLKEWRSIDLHLKDSLPPITGVKRYYRVSGHLLHTTADSIAIDFQEERWSEVRGNKYDFDPWRTEDILHFVKDTSGTQRSYALARIDHITYDRNLVGAGAAITVISAAGLLLYAPLKAMRFSSGTFDGDKYIQVATPCVIGLGVGLVVMPFTETKGWARVKLGT